MGWLEGHQPETARRPPANAAPSGRSIRRRASKTGPGWSIPRCKTVELIRRPIEWHTSPGENIYEPFAGSGTAIIAAEMTGRRCYALELAPQFVDVGVIRWQNYTGRQATLAGDGRTFAEIAAERGRGTTEGR